MIRYVGEIEGLPRIADCAEEIGAHIVVGAENHCTLAAVSLVPPIQVDLIILPIVQQVAPSAYL